MTSIADWTLLIALLVHTNPLARFALIAQGEQVHVANYPARPAGDAYDLRRAIEIRSAAHAFEGKCFVVVAGSVISDEMRRMLGDAPEKQRLLGTGSTTFTGILGPEGDVVGGPAPGDAETIVYGEIDLERIIRAKLIHDVAGNYNRFDVLSLTVNRAPLTALREVVEPARPRPASSTVTRSLTASADPVGERVMPAGQHERLGNMRERMRVGAAQVAPKFLDKAGTIRKVGATLEEAGRLGLDLIVFPETFIAAYPYWRGAVSVRRSTELCAAMQREAVRIPSDDTDALCEMARRSNVNCVVGLNELDDRPGSLTMYNTLLVIARDGRILGRHRKLVPTHSERVYWGMGDARDIRVFATDLGMLGGLVCYEHHMTLLRAALADLGEELHVAVWPGWWTMDGHLGAKRPEAGARACDIEPAIREYAIENSVFVVSSSWYLPPGDVPDDVADAMQYNLAIGGSCIVNPSGLWVREPVFDTETIVWAEIDQDDRRVAKAYFDSVGHYARRDLLRLVLNPGDTCEAAARVLEPSGARLRETAEQAEVRLARLEALVERLVNSIASAPRPDFESPPPPR